MASFVDTFPKTKLCSNKEIVKNTIDKYPGLRFVELSKETGLANGNLQHHIKMLIKSKQICVCYDKTTPRYFPSEFDQSSQIIIERLRQTTPSRIIKALLNNECQTFSQLVSFTKKSAGTVSIYKNLLLEDGILEINTDKCESTKDTRNYLVKYRLTNPDKIHFLMEEYSKTSFRNSIDNLADVICPNLNAK